MRTVYLDMDDVIADFKGYAISVLRKKQEDERWAYEEWTRLRDNPRCTEILTRHRSRQHCQGLSREVPRTMGGT
jgi:hypothetical protein